MSMTVSEMYEIYGWGAIEFGIAAVLMAGGPLIGAAGPAIASGGGTAVTTYSGTATVARLGTTLPPSFYARLGASITETGVWKTVGTVALGKGLKYYYDTLQASHGQ